MALQVSLTAEQSGIGAAIPAAYARIVAFQHSTQGGAVVFAVEYYWDAVARQTSLRPIGGQSFSVQDFDFTAQVGIKTALYNYLKTLPAFAGAVDV